MNKVPMTVTGEAALREELMLTGPAGCQLYAGELVPD